MSTHEEAATIFTRIFEALARQNGKTLSSATRADIGRACELLVNAGAELDDLLEDTLVIPRRRPAADPEWERFEQWRMERQ